MSVVLRSGIAISLLVGACGGRDRPAGGRPADQPASSDPAPAAGAAPAGAMSAAQPALRDPVPLKVSAEADGRRATYTGLGECHHTTDASIYEVPATMWSAHVAAESGDLRDLNLTLWQPKGAAELQVSLGLTIDQASLEIATVTGKGASLKGSGTGQAVAKGGGGSLQVEGKDAGGAAVRVTVDCERWTEPVAEGG